MFFCTKERGCSPGLGVGLEVVVVVGGGEQAVGGFESQGVTSKKKSGSTSFGIWSSL